MFEIFHPPGQHLPAGLGMAGSCGRGISFMAGILWKSTRPPPGLCASLCFYYRALYRRQHHLINALAVAHSICHANHRNSRRGEEIRMDLCFIC